MILFSVIRWSEKKFWTLPTCYTVSYRIHRCQSSSKSHRMYSIHFWHSLQRIRVTSVEPHHLIQYVDEQLFVVLTFWRLKWIIELFFSTFNAWSDARLSTYFCLMARIPLSKSTCRCSCSWWCCYQRGFHCTLSYMQSVISLRMPLRGSTAQMFCRHLD